MLRRKSERHDKELVGAYMDEVISYYLTLFSIAKGQSKSITIREQLTTWFENQKEDVSQLVEEITGKVQAEWVKTKRKDPAASYLKFRQSVRQELAVRGVKEQEIKTILTELNETNKETS